MIKVKFKYTGEIKEVSNNEAHGLIESGDAYIYRGKIMIGGASKRYKTKGR